MDNEVKKKTSHVFHLFLIALVLIAIRIWYLSFIQHDYYLQLSKRPQRRVLIEPSLRGTISDRFGKPMAINRLQYAACIYYDPIRHIPRVSYKKIEGGKKIKFYQRKAYVEDLAKLLASELNLDPLYVEDLIYSRAGIFPTTPILLKEDLREGEYYRLKILEKDWPGILVKMQPKRRYPQEKTAAEMLGYMGRINQREYSVIAHEKKLLQEFIADRENQLPVPLPIGYHSIYEIRKRLRELEEKSYTMNDYVGKTGIEGKFDKELRGVFGKKTFEVDVKGNILRQLPGSSGSLSGQHIQLSLSSELQKFAESLLAHHEKIRDKRFNLARKNYDKQPNPWVKGGAIVAMIPKTGEIVALASYPKMDPNDFIIKGEKAQKISSWLENEIYISRLWDGLQPLEKETYSLLKAAYETEEKKISWLEFIDRILSPKSKVKQVILTVQNLKTAYTIINTFESFLSQSHESPRQAIDLLYPKSTGHITIFDQENKNSSLSHQTLETFKAILDPLLSSLSHNQDKLLVLDLLRLCIDTNRFSFDLILKVGTDSLEEYHQLRQSLVIVENKLKKLTQELFHKNDFLQWRQIHFQEYLKEKRKKEKKEKSYEKPYLDYLQIKEAKLFRKFWQENRMAFLEAFLLNNDNSFLPPSLNSYFTSLLKLKNECSDSLFSAARDILSKRLNALERNTSLFYLQTMRSYAELSKPLFGRYRNVFSRSIGQTEKDLARSFYPLSGYCYASSHAYQQISSFGSLFKIVTGYESLKQHYDKILDHHLYTDLNPLTIIDDLKPDRKTKDGIILGYTLEGQPITQRYKGGRIPRSSHKNIGKVDFFSAMEQSSNVYFSLLASEVIENPTDLLEAAQKFGFGKKTTLELPGEAAGILPHDIRDNKSALYSFAIGQHTLLVTPLQAAQMLSILANKGKSPQIQILKRIRGKQMKDPEELFFQTSFSPIQRSFDSLGIDFPLFTETCEERHQSFSQTFSPKVVEEFEIPESLHNYLMESLRQVMIGEKGSGRYHSISYLYQYPHVRQIYRNLQPEVVGKTGTAEFYYRPTLDREGEGIICHHLWFGAISFEKENGEICFDKPELVVIVLLRFGDWGKEAAPLALQVIHKWREIQKKEHHLDDFEKIGSF